MNKRIDGLVTQVSDIREQDDRRDARLFARLENELRLIKESLQARDVATGDVNRIQHEENRRRLQRIEDTIQQMITNVPTIIAQAQSDLYTRVKKLEDK